MRIHRDDHSGESEDHRRILGSLGAFDVFLCASIIAGLVLRLWGLDSMEFKSDEFRDILNAYRASHAPWSAPLLVSEGTTASPGIFFYQLLAVPVSITRDPVSVARFIALLNVAAIPGLFLFIRRVFAARVALWATALFATAPWLIVFSRKIWNPDLLVPFLIITLALLLSAMRQYAAWKVYAFVFFLALFSQMHLSVWLVLLVLLPLGLLFRPFHRPFDFAVGVAIFLAVFVLTLGPHLGEFIAGFSLRGSTQPPEAQLFRLVGHNALESVRITSGSGFEFLLGTRGYAAFAEHPVVQLAQAGFLLYGCLVIAGFAQAIGRMAKASRDSFRHIPDRFLLLLLLMAGSLQVFYLVFRIYSAPHYHVILSLLPPLLVGLFLAWVADRSGRAGSFVSHVLLVLVLIANLSFGAVFLAFIRAHPDAIDGDYGQPYFVERQRWETRLGDAFRRIDDQVSEQEARASRRSPGSLAPERPEWRPGGRVARRDVMSSRRSATSKPSGTWPPRSAE